MIKELKNLQEYAMTDLEKERMDICIQCPIKNGDICDSGVYLNPKTNSVSLIPKEGYKRGCGCFLPSKVQKEWNHCPLGKW